VFRHMEVDGGFTGDDITSEIVKIFKVILIKAQRDANYAV